MIKKFQVPLMMCIVNIILTILAFNIDINKSIFLGAIWSGAGLMFLYQLVSIIFRTKLPKSLEWVYYIHIFIGMYIGTGLRGYDNIWWLDLFAHGIFGVEGCLFAYLILVKSKCIKNLSVSIFLLFLFSFTMGCAAVWEIYEYLFDILTGGDSQKVQYALNNSLYPITDTMEDIIISLIGVLLTFVGFFIDKHFDYKVCKKLYYDFIDDKLEVKDEESKNKFFI